MKRKLFLVFISFLAVGLFVIAFHSKQFFSSTRSLKKQGIFSAPLSSNLDSEPLNQHPSAVSIKPIETLVHDNSHDNTNTETSTITINNKKYNIATLDENDIDTITKTISTSQLNQIRNTILSPSENNLRRHSYLYFLTQIRSTGAKSLFEVVKAEVPEFEFQNNPHSSDADRKSVELSLRIAALEALDNLASMDPQVGSYLKQLESSYQAGATSDNSILSYLTSISNAGLDNNTPGKLHRVLNAILQENETL